MTGQDKNNLYAKKIGENIRKYRRKRKLSIHKLAEYAIIDEKNLGRIERGQRTPRADTIGKILIVLEISANELLEGTLEYLETLPKEYWDKEDQ